MVENNKKKAAGRRIRVEPGIYRRGTTYEIRVPYIDTAGRRRERWTTVGTSIRDARRELVEARAAGLHGQIATTAGARLTVERFLEDHFLPYLLEERVNKAGDLARNTYVQYRRYARQKVVPAIGTLRVADVNTGHIEAVLNDLRVGGRHPDADMGRPRAHPRFVYDTIATGRGGGRSYADIAATLAAEHPESCAGLTKDAVAAIHRRSLAAPARPEQCDTKLDVSTISNIHAMLRSAWRYGVKYDLIPRNRQHVVAEATLPARPKNQPPPEVITWTPDEYSRFFDWAVTARPDSWVAFYFVATSGDRVSGNLGLRWSDVDLDSRTARLTNFVKYHGEPGERVLVEAWGKTNAGQEITLDRRTIEVLRVEKSRQVEMLRPRTDRHNCDTVERNCELPGYHDRNLVFPQRDGNYRDPNKFLDLFKDAIRAYNRQNPEQPLPVITLHALRHGWSTTAEAAGVSERVRMDRLGQTSTTVNRRYTHAMQEAREAAAEAVSDMVFASSVHLGPLGSARPGG